MEVRAWCLVGSVVGEPLGVGVEPELPMAGPRFAPKWAGPSFRGYVCCCSDASSSDTGSEGVLVFLLFRRRIPPRGFRFFCENDNQKGKSRIRIGS